MLSHNSGKGRMRDPYDVLALSILNEAKNDAQIFLDFQEEFGMDGKNQNAHDIAIWVGEWLYKNTKGGKNV